MNNIDSIEDAKQIITDLQRQRDKAERKVTLVMARLYDIIHKDEPEPTEAEHKAFIIHLQQLTADLIKQRDDLKKELRTMAEKLEKLVSKDKV